jgi:hypothetical protein
MSHFEFLKAWLGEVPPTPARVDPPESQHTEAQAKPAEPIVIDEPKRKGSRPRTVKPEGAK